MEILAIFGIIALVLFLFVGGGIVGWALRALEGVFNVLLEGNQNCLGCIFRIIVGLLLLGAAIAIL